MDKIVLEIKKSYSENKTNMSWLVPFVIFAVWTIDSFISIFTTGITSFDWTIPFSIIFKLVTIGLNLFFAYKFLIKNDSNFYKKVKTYSGYFIVFVYVTHNLPRLSWEMADIISQGKNIQLWVFSFISSIWPTALYCSLWYKKNQEKWGVYISKKEEKELKKKEKKKPIKKIVWENVDAILQAIIMVIIIQHFLFQNYQIPTESMVPTFLTQDRIFFTKFTTGPTIPLTKWHLPVLDEPKRGDMVAFEKPEYTHKSLARRILWQFVFYSTVTLVNLDTEPCKSEAMRQQFNNKCPRVRFVVKRVIGEPGEKLLMVDDVVYVKTKNDNEFKVLEIDQNEYSHIDLYKEPSSIKKHINWIPIEENVRSFINEVDDYKNSNDINYFNSLLENEYKTFSNLKNSLSKSQIDSFYETYLAVTNKDIISWLKTQKGILNDTKKNIFQNIYAVNVQGVNNNYYLEDFVYFYDSLEKGDTHLDKWINSSLDSKEQDLNIYEKSVKKTNIIYKTAVLERFNAYLNSIKSDPESDIRESQSIYSLWEKSSKLGAYLSIFMFRNFPEFPAGKDNYINENNYFLMGDNRYNSLDFRFRENAYEFKKLDPNDELSPLFYSNLDPHPISKDNLLGYAGFTFWPFNRFKIH